MSQEIIANRLKQAMGLHVDTVGMVTIANAITRRMRHHDISNHDAYLALLESRHGELQELIEAVIIPETWFFRDEYPYRFIAEFMQQRIRDKGILPVNILSVPCSTGEEPYSIAMELDSANISPDLYRIEALDISRPSLDKARTGHYRKNSFRSSNLEFVDRYFNKYDDYYEIKQEIRERIHFRHGNIISEEFCRHQQVYDIVLCRNLLIYFDAETQARVFGSLRKILKKNGRLILGHAETHHASEGGFSPLGRNFPYVFLRSDADDPALPSPGTGKPAADKVSTRKTPTRPVQRPFANVQPPVPVKTVADITAELASAFDMANSGDTEAARRICMQLLEDDSSNPDVYYLLGLIADLSSEPGTAEEYMRKAIYLDPDHYEALIHISMMSQHAGNRDSALRFKERAERALQKRSNRGDT